MDIAEKKERKRYTETMSGAKKEKSQEKPFGSGKIKYWFTANGKKIPVFDGETQEQALQRNIEKGEKAN